MIPFRNREACHRCHDPEHRHQRHPDLRPRRRRAARVDERATCAGSSRAPAPSRCSSSRPSPSSSASSCCAGCSASRPPPGSIAAGDLDRRVPAEGSDTISWLAREFNTMADSMTGLRRRGPQPARAPRDGHQQHRRRHRRARPETEDRGAANDAFLRASCGDRASTCSAARAVRPPRACAASPTARRWPACASGERQVRICERRDRRRRGAVGGGARVARFATRPASSCRSSRCGATSRSVARPRPASPNRTGSRRSACWRRASRTSSTRRWPRC